MPVSTQVLRALWSTTLSLPKSTLPPRAVLADRPEYLHQCTEVLYAQSLQRVHNAVKKGAKVSTFTLHDGPPYANGNLHIGHALNKILKDITCRFQLALNKHVRYIPGWDCHGLPIELKALKKQKELGVIGGSGQLDAIGVRNVARELAARTVEEQKNGFRGWGIMADWKNAWTTMDKGFELGQLEVFKQMVIKGLIYRRFKPVYWSPSSRTALAEAELEYNQDHVSTAAFVKFPLISVPLTATQSMDVDWQNVSAVIWTTTPWTLPANKAIAVSYDLDYVVVVSSNHGLLLMAESRVPDAERLFEEKLTRAVHKSIRGSNLVGATYRSLSRDGSPMKPPKVICADFVTAESGSGLVHIAPGHGMDDYKLCQEYGVDIFAPVDDHGCFTQDAWPNDQKLLAGRPVLTEGSIAVLDLLSTRKALITSHEYRHKYPYDWRSKQPVIIRATEQWFADVGEIRDTALHALDQVKFVPESSKERLVSFVRNRAEWCISRQRAWGVPVPALYHRDTGSALMTEESVSHIISIIQARGVDAWWTDDQYDPAWTPVSLRDNTGKSHYRRGQDTMDVWFDSGTSWTQTSKSSNEDTLNMSSQDAHVPIGSTWSIRPSGVRCLEIADVYLEGTDQHRGWFQSSLLTSIAYQSSTYNGPTIPLAPYRTLITHGFTLDQSGRKMSKSEGNVISPDQIMDGSLLPPMKRKKNKSGLMHDQAPVDTMGPDALRLWVAGCDYTKDVIVGQSVLQAVQNSLSKLRVTFKLLLGLLADRKDKAPLNFEKLGIVDQLALIQLRSLLEKVRRHYEDFEYHKVTAYINQYVNTDLSAFYIESIKDRMYADAVLSKERRQAQQVLQQIHRWLLCMLAPVTPLLVAEVNHHMRSDTRQLPPEWLSWDTLEADVVGENPVLWQNDELETHMPYFLSAHSAVKSAQEAARRDKKMGSSLQSFVLLQINVEAKEETSERNKMIFQRHVADLENLFVVSKVETCVGPVPEHVLSAEWLYTASFVVDGQTVVAHVYAPEQDKCVRCWRYAVPKDSDLEEALCRRCVGVLEGMREDKPEVFEGRPRFALAASACRRGHEEDLLKDHWHFL
ncbi:MAG: hypothetical protein Q9187_000316 [Circinaria calcarea]